MPWYRRSGIGARLIALCCLLAIACGGEQPGSEPHAAATPVRRDSAGVAILEYPAGVAQRVPQWTVDTEPLAVIGDDPDGKDDVTQVYRPMLLPDGTIAFWDGNDSQLALFAPNGELRRRIGRRGQGPDEFGFVDAIAHAGDTILVPDFGNDRLTAFSPDGQQLGVLSRVRACGRPASVLGRFPDGTLVAATYYEGLERLPVDNSIVRPVHALLLIGPDACDTLMMLPGPAMRVVEFHPRGHSMGSPRLVRYGPNTVVALWSGMAAIGTAENYQLDLLAQTGVLRRSIRLAWLPTASPDGLRDSVIAQDLERLAAPGAETPLDLQESERLVRQATFVADSLPPYNDLLVGTDHKLWVVDAWAPGLPERSALAFSPSGTIEARLTMPARFTPMAFGPNRVLTRVVDPETGVVTFRVLRMHEADR